MTSYFETFELKNNVSNFRSICFYFQSEGILILVYFEKVNQIECSFLFYKGLRSSTLVQRREIENLVQPKEQFLLKETIA